MIEQIVLQASRHRGVCSILAAGQREAEKRRRRSKGEATVKEESILRVDEEEEWMGKVPILTDVKLRKKSKGEAAVKEESILKEEWMEKVPTLVDAKLKLNLKSDIPDMGEVVEMKNNYETNGCQPTKNEVAKISQGPNEVTVNVIPRSNPEFEMAAETSQGHSDIKVKVNIIPGSTLEEERAAKKRKMYKEDKLLLVCEWGGCGKEEENPDLFTWHVSQHCNDAEVKIRDFSQLFFGGEK